MKKIEAIIRPEKVRAVLSALKEVGVTGVTVVSARGQGSGARPLIRDSRGTPLHAAEYNTMNSVITIVNDTLVDTVMTAIAKVASNGSKGSGKIFVFPVDEVMDLETGRRSTNSV